MFKKLKKHKLSLFLLAMVCMLSVYYVLMPEDNEPNAPVSNIPTGKTRYQEFMEMRLEITDERNAILTSYEEKIVDEVNTSLLEEYVVEIDSIMTLTEKEVYIEGVLMNLGYIDCLVYMMEDGDLTISVLADEFSKEDYIEVVIIAKEEFGIDTFVTVNFTKSS